MPPRTCVVLTHQLIKQVELRDGDHKPLMSFDSTVLTAVPEWRLVSSTLFGFGPGVRYLYWEVRTLGSLPCLTFLANFTHLLARLTLTLGARV